MEEIDPIKKIAFGVTLSSVGIFMVLYSKTFPKVRSGGDVMTGPGFFPTIIGMLLLIFGFYVLILGLIRKGKLKEKIKRDSNMITFLKSKEFLYFLLFIIFTAAYPTVTIYFGFFIGAFLFCFILMKVLQAKWISAIVSSIVLIATVYIIFEMVAHIPLPIGTIFTS